LPVASGNIPGAPLVSGAYCVRNASSRITILIVSSGAAQPSGWTQICQIPFTIATNATNDVARLNGFQQGCASSGGPQPCTVFHGQITVSGGGGSFQMQSAEDNSVAALLTADSDAPVPEVLSSIDYRTDTQRLPIAALERARPLRVRPLMPLRAQGDLKTFIRENPRSSRAIIERYVLVEYASRAAALAGLDALKADRFVERASLVEPSLPIRKTQPIGKATTAVVNQYHLTPLQFPNAWDTATRGWSLVGAVESGVDTTHPLIRSFAGATYQGGNFLPVYSFDFAPGQEGPNVDERQPVRAPPGTPAGCVIPASSPTCTNDPETNGFECMVTSTAGHGTHVAGLIAGNATSAGAEDMQGICRNCGVGVIKVARALCIQPQGGQPLVTTAFVPSLAPPALIALTQAGSQIINVSLGAGLPDNYCENGANPGAEWCAALNLAAANDVIVVAASGNFRGNIQFPAADDGVLAVGGADEVGSLWDEAPGDAQGIGCPNYNPNTPNAPENQFECGSSYTRDLNKRHQELVVPAKNVRSTFYRGLTWSAPSRCGDSYGDATASDGVGLCTGTSMSAPIVAGVMGLLRSINPLAPKGDPENAAVYGVRDVVAETTDRAVAGQPWSAQLGYGMPRVRAAADRILGRVRGDVVPNRLTPLFTLYSPGGLDFANVASPQGAVALIRFSSASYTTTTNPASATTPGFASFRTENPAPPVPRANMYVLTTEASLGNGAAIVPLYWLDRERPWPLGCTETQPGCAFFHRDNLLVSSTAHVEAAVAQGYRFRGRQGFVYARCAGDLPSCMPAGTELMYRLCKAADDDCAVFLESQRPAYQALGYTQAFPAGADSVMGYAYPNVDSDNDGLVDGMERIIGTNLADQDADDDGVLDGIEFPQAGIALTDPCAGPNITCTRLPNQLFANGFE